MAKTRTRKRTRDVESAATVARVRKRGGDVVEEKKSDPAVEMAELTAHTARIRVAGSITNNLGDFNSVKVSVELELPFDIRETDVEDMYQQVSDHVDRMLNDELDAALEAEEESDD